MSHKKDSSESSDTGGYIESGYYDDDFEKDLEWLINEEEKGISSDTQNHDESEDDVETTIYKVFKESERNSSQPPEPEKVLKDERPPHKVNSILEHGTQQLKQAFDTDSEDELKQEETEELDEDDEAIKRYILEKIEEANKLLLCQEPLDESKERKLKFKDDLVDLEVPPLKPLESDNNYPFGERDISGRLSQLRLSNRSEDLSLSVNGGTDDEHKDGKILVERDGKFELLSIHDIESQGFFPPLNVAFSDIEAQHISPKTSYTTAFGTVCRTKEENNIKPSCSSSRERCFFFPQPPAIRPSSAINITRNVERGKSPRRVQSANINIRSTTYCLSPRQKELQKQMEQRKEKQKKEEEARRRLQEEEKRRENEMVFRAWLQKKKGQMEEEKRIQRAKEIEDLNTRQECRDPDEAFKSWLKRKQEEQVKEKLIQNIKEREECTLFLPRTVENDKAYKQWLRKKRRERKAEQLAAKERAKQLRQEARRAKQIENIICSISEPKSLRFTDQFS